MIPSGMVVSIFFQSIGKPAPAMVISLSRQIIFLIPAMFLLGAFMGVDGLLWAGPAADLLSGVVSLVLVKIYWKKIFTQEPSLMADAREVMQY